MTYTNLQKITELNERLCEEGKKGLSPRRGKTEKDKKSGPSEGGGKRNRPKSFNAPRKAGPRKRN